MTTAEIGQRLERIARGLTLIPSIGLLGMEYVEEMKAT